MKKRPQYETLTLDKIVGGGQALGTLSDGRKAFVWGGLPGEQVTIRITKKKSHFVEGIVSEVHSASPERIAPLDPDNYLSTSPWQIMRFDAEQHYKAALIEEAFELHGIVLPDVIDVYTDDITAGYRNKVEFSWFGDTRDGVDTLDLAFFMRGGMGKIPITHCSLLPEPMMQLALALRDVLRQKSITARNLKTLLIRSDQQGNCVWQLYLKDSLPDLITTDEAAALPAIGGEVIYSNPKSPASVITERLASFGTTTLTDTILGVPFRYATEGFFQVNIPVYERALRDMGVWVGSNSSVSDEGSAFPAEASQERKLDQVATSRPEADNSEFAPGHRQKVIDLYSGVGSIGLTIGGPEVTLIEINEHAVREMRENITRLSSNATAVLAPAEKALEHLSSEAIIIVDPPRAGLHRDVIDTLLKLQSERLIYLSCNPVTQARDVALLAEIYGIRAHRGYNFFPRTPHIEHLVVLDRKK